MVPLRVLLVEDSEIDALLLVRELRRGDFEVAYRLVKSAEAMAEALGGQVWDVVIADMVLPRFSGLAALAQVKEIGVDLPVILVSGKVSEDLAVEAMKAGACDFLSKGNLARLVPAIQRELREAAVRRERKQMAEQLERAQRLEIAGTIAGQVAHDFNNLLAPLVGYAQLIKKRLPPDHPAIEFCDIMGRAAQQMAAINEDLLTLARRGHFDPKPLNLNHLILQAVEQIRERPDQLAIELDLSPELPPVAGSEGQLHRAFFNLISNSRDAMRDDGVLRITTKSMPGLTFVAMDGQSHVKDHVCVRISDTGCGIPAEIREKIFDPFFTTKKDDRRRGSGLGLSVVQAIVSDHRGFVDVESEVGHGTTFSIYLPIDRKTPAEETNGEVPGGDEAILVVDDEEVPGTLTKEQLESLGYRVSLARNGDEALSFLRGHRVDLLVLDMIMADGFDGAQIYQHALQLYPEQRAIVVSAYGELEQVRKVQELGLTVFLRKPVTLEKLARAVRRGLETS